MILYRCFPWNSIARHDEPDGPLWVPRRFQGDGRHDNPDLYGCLYAAESAVSCIVEHLARFRGRTLKPSWLRQRGLALALTALELTDDANLIDLDDPTVLSREHLRPSTVATRDRAVTQPRARLLYERHAEAAGLRWWSTFEALWINITLFDRAAPRLGVREVRRLTADDPAVVEAAEALGLR